MTRKIVALDIRNDKISAILIKTVLKGNSIEALAVSKIPAVSEDHDETKNRLAEAIEKTIKEFDISGAEFVVSIPPDLVSYRNLRVPFKDRKKIRQVLPFEIEPTLPFPIDEVTIDYQPVRQTDRTDIIACAIRTSDLATIVDTLKTHNIDPQVVTTGGLPTALCLAKFSDISPPFIFMDLDSDNCSFFAIISGKIHLSRTFQASAISPDAKAEVIIKQMLQFLASFEAFYEFGFEPFTICISGEGIDIDIFRQKLEAFTNASVQSVNMLEDVLKDTRRSDGISFSPEHFNGALSLAAAEIPGIDMINFYGERSIFKRYWEENKNDIIKTSAIAMLVFIIFMFNVLLEARYLDRSIRTLNQQIMMIFQSTFPDVTKIVDPVQQMRAMIQDVKGKSSYAGEIEEITRNVDILNEISQLVPDPIDVEFTQFVRGDENILISGHTDTFNAVNEIKGKLEKSKLFKNITINSANLDATSNRVQFKLKVDL